MAVVRMMQATVHEIVDMIAVRNRLVAAAWAVGVTGADVVRRAARGVRCIDGDRVLIDVIAVHVVQVTVVQVVDMPGMPDRRVPTARAVLMGMIGVVWFGASRHGHLSLVETNAGEAHTSCD